MKASNKPAAAPAIIPPPVPTAAELKARIAADANRRSADCLAEIKQALEKYRCEIVAQPRIEAGVIIADWGIGAHE